MNRSAIALTALLFALPVQAQELAGRYRAAGQDDGGQYDAVDEDLYVHVIAVAPEADVQRTEKQDGKVTLHHASFPAAHQRTTDDDSCKHAHQYVHALIGRRCHGHLFERHHRTTDGSGQAAENKANDQVAVPVQPCEPCSFGITANDKEVAANSRFG